MQATRSFPGAILMGAPYRLLPPWIPFRFFLSAVLFHIALWVLVGLAAAEIPGFAGGSGAPLAALHTLTLGVFMTTVMGAASQLLPVATGVAHRSLLPIRAAFWLYLPGAVTLIVGFHFSDGGIMRVGGTLTVVGIGFFAFALADLLPRARALKMPVRFVWTAWVSLLLLALLGLALIEDFRLGFLADRGSWAAAHLILAAFGFFGMLTFGFANILVPMFALSKAPEGGPAKASLALGILALVSALAGIAWELPWVVTLGALLGLGAAAAHIRGMGWCLKTGMRGKLGLSFVLIRSAWGLLVAALVAGALLPLGLLGERGAALFGFVALFGWLLTFLLGILQRIIPFLAGMNMSGGGVKPPRLSELADERWLTGHAVCHAAALLLVGGGILFDVGDAVRAGALAGVTGALAFAWFAFSVARSFRAYQRAAIGAKKAP